MRYGIFSDIHSNLEALEVILEFFRNQNINSYICCGDIVGYGPNPNECIEIVKALPNFSSVLGNHDAASCGLKETTWFNEYAQEAIYWTRKQLKEENRMYITGLPKEIQEKTLTVVHGSPRNPIDEYLLTRTEFVENLNYFNTQICFVGHTHSPVIFLHDTTTKTNSYSVPDDLTKVSMKPDYKYIINVGSVGQPRDSDPRTCCVVYDTNSQEIEFFRFVYDFPKTQTKMYHARLPAFLIERLTWGR